MTTRAKHKGGRPRAEWDEKDIKTFKSLCAQFNTEDDICAIMGVTDKTLVELINRYLYEEITGHKRRGTAKKVSFSDAFEKYSANGRMSLRREQFKLAMNGDKTMLIWLGKQYLDQREPEPTKEAETVREAHMFVFEPGSLDG